MAIVAILIFGAALAASVLTLWATIAPQSARIRDLLANGPLSLPVLPTPVPARSVLRNVSVRRAGSVVAQRAAA